MIWKIALIVLGIKFLYELLFPDTWFDVMKPPPEDAQILYERIMEEKITEKEYYQFYNKDNQRINIKQFFNDYYNHELKSKDKYIIT